MLRGLRLLLGLITWLTLGWGQATKTSESSRLLLYAEVAPQAAPAGTPVYLYVRLRNISSEAIELGDTNGYFDFWFTVTDENNHELPEKHPGSREALTRATRMTLEAGEEQVAVLEVAHIYAAEKIGKYVIHVTRRGFWERTRDGGRPGEIASAVPLTFAVTDGSAQAAKEFHDPFSEQAAARLAAINSQAELELSAYPLTLAVTQHEPVIMQLGMRNRSGKDLPLLAGMTSERDYLIHIKRPDGTTATSITTDWPGNGVMEGPTAIKAGALEQSSLVLSRWEDFEQTGEYSVEITTPRSTGPAVVKVIILPRDPGRLQALCAELSQKRFDRVSGRALSSVRDDIAVPFLVELARFQPDAVYGLGRIDSVASVGALAGLTHGSFARAAVDSLKRIQSNTKSNEVRAAADAALMQTAALH